MPRARGEAAKLGDHYEGIWTVDNLLDLLSGEAISLQPEPFDATEAEGIEFIKSLADGKAEYHSAKRQKPGIAWSLADLTRPHPNGHSILGDLFSKLALHKQAVSVFVSQTGANELLELCDRARRSASLTDLRGQLKEPKVLAEGFENRILRLCENEPGTALGRLKRLRVVSIDEQELLKRTEQKVAQWIYRRDGNKVEAGDVRRMLAEYITNHLGQAITKRELLAELEEHGLHLRVWASETSLLTRVSDLNEGYLRTVRDQLINGQPILRAEAKLALEQLTNGNGQKAQLIVGSAGLGKTCVMAEIVDQLAAAHVPVICLRLDNLPKVLTTESLGRELGLPSSPAIVLGGIANGGKCVLVVDQLDALSSVSGRNDHLWPVFHLLLAEAGRIPNMRLLLACRAFDLQHDKRLRDLTGKGHLAAMIELSLLDVAQVGSAVRAIGGNPARLSDRQIELLRTPFNLRLFLEGEPGTHSSFRSVKDLFDRFWECKVQVVRPFLQTAEAWHKCISTLAQALSSGSSSAPLDILDHVSEDAKILASHGVLVLENRRWRFFHETFGDYAFARQFAREERDLVSFLVEGGEQHLYRRAQTRQILAYERDRDRKTYIRTLGRLLAETKVRMHIKRLALEWLSQLDNPGEDEWQLIHPLLHDAALAASAVSVLWERLPWFDLLYRLGAWPKLLADERDQLGLRLTHMFGMDVMMRERSVAIANLFSPPQSDVSGWQNRLRLLFQFGQVHHSREMFDLVLACLEAGVFDDLDRRQSLLIHQLTEAMPEYAAEFIGRCLDRLGSLALTKGETNPFSDPDPPSGFRPKRYIRDSEIRSVAEKAPLAFAVQIAPRLQRLIAANALPPENGQTRDKIWRFLTLGAEHDLDDALLFSTARTLRRLAAEHPGAVEEITKGWAELPHRTIRFLLLQAWSGNGRVFANKAAAYFIDCPTALELGYDMMVGAEGTGRAAISREALQAISPHCADDLHTRLETSILSLGAAGGGEDGTLNRFTEFALLQCLLPQRLAPASQARLKELKAAFPDVALSLPVVTGVFSMEKSPPPVDFARLSDEQWLALFKENSKEGESRPHGRQSLEVWDILGPLSSHARADRRRFAALTAQMADDVFPAYFNTVLEAIGQNDDSEKASQSAPPVGTEELCKVILRLHNLPNRPCGGAICRVIFRNAHREFPPEILDLVGHYALNDPDPTPDSHEHDGKELVNHAINTVRGSAADAIASLLFKNPDLATRGLPTIEKLAQDAAPCIRAVTIHPLVALLNRDRESAVRIFQQICASDPRMWTSHHVEDFIFYATFTHYAKLQPLLRQMLAGIDEEAKTTAARQICMAAFQHPEAEVDLAAVLGGDKTCRQAAAQIYSQNHIHPTVRASCERHLMPLLNDADSEVRGSADFWNANLKVIVADGDWNFFRQYLETTSFAEEPGAALHQLREISAVPEDIVMRIATRAVELSQRDLPGRPVKAFRFADYTPTLIVRLYHQTDDDFLKTRCLDLLDAMIALGWNEAYVEIAKAERL
jgi:hypothetical protein